MKKHPPSTTPRRARLARALIALGLLTAACAPEPRAPRPVPPSADDRAAEPPALTPPALTPPAFTPPPVTPPIEHAAPTEPAPVAALDDAPTARPRFTAARAVRRADAPITSLHLTVADADTTLERITLAPLDAHGEQIAAPAPIWQGRPHAARAPLVRVELTRSVPLAAAALALVAHDAHGRATRRDIPIERAATHGPGEPCDPRGHGDACDTSLWCAPFVGRGRCARLDRPTIVDAEARVGEERQMLDPGDYRFDATLTLRIEAIAGPSAQVTVRTTPVDARRRPVGLDRVSAPMTLDTRPLIIRTTPWRQAHAPVAGVRVELTDSEGNTSLPRFVPLRPVERAPAGQLCDRALVSPLCPIDARCVGDDDIGRCETVRPPTLDPSRSHLLINRGMHTYALWLEGSDPDDARLHRFRVAFALDGEPIDAPTHVNVDETNCTLEGACRWIASHTMPPAVHAALAARPDAPVTATVQTQSDLMIDPITIELVEGGTPRILGDGEPCNGDRTYELCLPDSVCHSSTGLRDGICRARRRGTAPELVEAWAYVNEDARSIGVRARGRDAEHDARLFALRFFDAAGAPIESLGWPRFAREEDYDPEVFTLGLSLSMADLAADPDAAPPVVDSIEIRVIDTTGLASAPRRVALRETPRVGEGTRCDPEQGLARCDEGLVCLDYDPHTDLEHHCMPRVPDCPADWDVDALDAHPDGDGWRVEGDTTGGLNRVMRIDGATGPDAIFTFTAPDDGMYAFILTGDHRPTLYGRPDCLFEEGQLEPHSRERDRLFVELAAGQTIHLMADGEGADAGPFVLTAARHRPPVIAEISARAGEAGNFIALELTVADDTAEPSLIHADAIDDSGEERGWVTPARLTPTGAVGGRRTYRAETTLDGARRGADRPARLRLTLTDAAGHVSDPLDVPLRRPRLVGKGAPCDPHQAATLCAAPYQCPEAATGRPSVCQLVDATCPEDWPVRDLDAHPRDDGWLAFGVLDGEHTVAGPVMSCDETLGRPDVFRFTAPRAGQYHFAAAGARALSARATCGVFRDLACTSWRWDDDAPLSLTLAAGEVIYLFLDARWPSSGGYSLAAEAL